MCEPTGGHIDRMVREGPAQLSFKNLAHASIRLTPPEVVAVTAWMKATERKLRAHRGSQTSYRWTSL